MALDCGRAPEQLACGLHCALAGAWQPWQVVRAQPSLILGDREAPRRPKAVGQPSPGGLEGAASLGVWERGSPGPVIWGLQGTVSMVTSLNPSLDISQHTLSFPIKGHK